MHRGVTFIEIVVVLAIIGISILPILTLFRTTSKQIKVNEEEFENVLFCINLQTIIEAANNLDERKINSLKENYLKGGGLKIVGFSELERVLSNEFGIMPTVINNLQVPSSLNKDEFKVYFGWEKTKGGYTFPDNLLPYFIYCKWESRGRFGRIILPGIVRLE